MFKPRYFVFLTIVIFVFNISNYSFLIAQNIDKKNISDSGIISKDLEHIPTGKNNTNKNNLNLPIKDKDIKIKGQIAKPLSKEDNSSDKAKFKKSLKNNSANSIIIENPDNLSKKTDDTHFKNKIIPIKSAKEISVVKSKLKPLTNTKNISEEKSLFIDFSRDTISKIDDIFFKISKQADLAFNIYEDKVNKAIDYLLSEIGLEYGSLKGKERFEHLKDKIKNNGWDDIYHNIDKIYKQEEKFLDLLDIFNKNKKFVSDLSIDSKLIDIDSFKSSEDILKFKKKLLKSLKEANDILIDVNSNLVKKTNSLVSKLNDEIALILKKMRSLKNGIIVMSPPINLDKKSEIFSNYFNIVKNKIIMTVNSLIKKISPIYLSFKNFIHKQFIYTIQWTKKHLKNLLNRLDIYLKNLEKNKQLRQDITDKINVLKLRINSLFNIVKLESLAAYDFIRNESKIFYSKTDDFFKRFVIDVKRRSVELRKKH